jgi:hypothetical protein
MEALAPARRLASPTIRALLARRLAEFGGLVLGLAAVALLVALVTYDPLDPSLNTATVRIPTNLAGPPGAIAADLLLQAFGVAAVLPSLAALAWAWRIASHRGLGSFAARLATTLAALAIISGVMSAVPWPAAVARWPTFAGPGGAVGHVLAKAVLGWATAVVGPFGGLAACMIGARLGKRPARCETPAGARQACSRSRWRRSPGLAAGWARRRSRAARCRRCRMIRANPSSRAYGR